MRFYSTISRMGSKAVVEGWNRRITSFFRLPGFYIDLDKTTKVLLPDGLSKTVDHLT